MSYVGNPIDTRNTFQSLQGKRFSGNGSTTDFTLDVAPGSVLDIEVFVGNVRQDPNSAYTLSGTTLSFTGAPPSGTNNIYVVHQAKSVGTIDVPASGVQAGSLASTVLTGQTDIGAGIADADLFLVDDGAGGTLRKTAASRIKTYVGGFDVSSITGATELAATPADTDEFVISDAGVLKRVDYSYIKGGNNKPLVSVYASADTSMSDNSFVKVPFNTENFDADNTFDNSSNYRFVAPNNGKYLITTQVGIQSNSDDGLYSQQTYIAKNGAEFIQKAQNFGNARARHHYDSITVIASLSASDYIEVFTRADWASASSSNIYGGSKNTFINILEVIE
jgi:hypothetical protein